MRKTERFTFFFSEHDVFSNWYHQPFMLRGVLFGCVEQAMMYAKAIEFGDTAIAAKILAEPHPRQQKKLGRQVKPYDDARWKAVARNVVYAAAHAKFTQHADLGRRLRETHGTILVEASPYDNLWGVGLGQNDPRIEDPSKWLGLNWLGEVLTRLRTDLEPVWAREQQAKAAAHAPDPTACRSPRMD